MIVTPNKVEGNSKAMFLVSVILPCYNVELYIDRAIKSIINQTIGFENIELICVDDCSEDSTVEKLEVWESLYPDNIMLVKCQKNGRQGAARNIGLNYATSDYVAFIDSDDWVELEYLEYLYRLISKEQLQVVTCTTRRDTSEMLTYFDDNQAESDTNLVFINSDDDRRKLLVSQPFGGVYGKIIERKFLIENNMYFPEGLAYEDIYWNELIHVHLTRGMLTNRCMYHYFVNSNSTVLKKDESYHYDYFVIANKVWDYWEKLGLIEKFRYELEYEYMLVVGLQMMKVLTLRFTTPQYLGFKRLQKLIQSRIPRIKGNPYISNNYFDEKKLLLIDFLYTDVTEDIYKEIEGNIRLFLS